MDKSQIKQIESGFIVTQKEVCKRFSAPFLDSPFDKIVGVALRSFETFNMPINGLRHPIEADSSTSWYIWAGELSQAEDFFQPVHVLHLLDICPKALHYLGLAPGWRFLFDNSYEDIWYDANLLNI